MLASVLLVWQSYCFGRVCEIDKRYTSHYKIIHDEQYCIALASKIVATFDTSESKHTGCNFIIPKQNIALISMCVILASMYVHSFCVLKAKAII